MSKLRVRPQDGPLVHDVTPESAGWTHVGFSLHRLAPGARIERAGDDREVCVVLVSGTARVGVGDTDFGVIGGRASPFEGAPDSVYAPFHMAVKVTAETNCEVAICTAPGGGEFAPRRISPADVGQETRGKATNIRHVRNILPETEPAHALLVVEVITPSGHWSSYPPHKHDRDALPQESSLEETYYHRFNPPQGYAVQRVYTDDRSLDETILVEDGDVVLVPRGYHPVGAAHGYDLWYLNVMAGPQRIWRFHNDPAHAWMLKG